MAITRQGVVVIQYNFITRSEKIRDEFRFRRTRVDKLCSLYCQRKPKQYLSFHLLILRIDVVKVFDFMTG